MDSKKYIINNALLMQDWDYVRNGEGGFDPNQLTEGSNKKVWWVCSACQHKWQAQIQKRAVRGQGCPICGREKQRKKQLESLQQKLTSEGSLFDKYPQLEIEWDYSKNAATGLDPAFLASGSNKKAWWKCSLCGNEWETQVIKRTARGQGCPTCARQKQNEQQAERIKERIRTEGSFGDKYPELLDEWDYEKNQNTPYDYLAYSQEQVFWTCSKCGYQWKSSISSRSAGHGCRQCGRQEGNKTLVRNLIAVKGSLADNNPDLATEWHPTKNGEMTPQTVMSNSKISAWWKCKVCGYEWEASIAGRNTGGGCHRCLAKQQRISLSTPIIGVNDLASQRPDLAAEWHPTKNGNLTPRDVTRSANKKAWWLGTCGHEWEAVIGSRHLGRGCPVCVREFKISYPEKAIFFYLKKYLSEYVVLENYKPSWLHGKEIDIYIEKLRLGIEYDGVAWHKDPTPDNDKDAVCALHGVNLLRIREKGAPPLNSTNIFWVKNCSESEEELTSAILYVFDYIRQNHNIECDIEIDIDANRIAIYSLLEMQKKANSVATLFPDVATEWHPTKNGHISPEYVSAHTHKEFWWICPNGHEYSMVVKHKTEDGCKCPICSNHRLLRGYNDLLTKRPDIAAEWHPTLNGELTPSDVMEFSNKRVWWICSNGHAYKYLISHKTRKICKCPICTNRQLCVGINDLCTVNPSIAQEWNIDRNEGLQPTEFTPISGKRVWWKCSVCDHEWSIKISDRFVLGHGCPKCAGNKRWDTRKRSEEQ